MRRYVCLLMCLYFCNPRIIDKENGRREPKEAEIEEKRDKFRYLYFCCPKHTLNSTGHGLTINLR